MSIDPNSAAGRLVLAALAAGRAVDLTPTPPAPRAGPARGRAPPALVAEGSVLLRGVLTFIIPVVTVSEANERSWKGKAARAGGQRRAVCRVLSRQLRALADLADHYHAGHPLEVEITRLGGRRLDAMSNLGSALKAVEDAACLVLGADDGDPRWRCRAAQRPGGAVGVRIDIRRGEGGPTTPGERPA